MLNPRCTPRAEADSVRPPTAEELRATAECSVCRPKKTPKLKVFGYLLTVAECPPAPNGSRQTRAIVAAPSQKAAAEAFGVSLHEFRNYGGETGNAGEIEVATSDPGVVYWSDLDTFPRRWTKLARRPWMEVPAK